MGDLEEKGEAERVAALEGYDLLDTPVDEALDRVTRLACQFLQTPIALVSLIDSQRQWFKSRVGLDADETPREHAFCDHAIRGDDLLIVPDASNDSRFADNPLVVGAPNIRFYAGAPLVAPCGAKLGTLCVIDRAPRQLTDKDRQVLRDLAAIVMDEIELRRLASTDPLTGMFNRRHILEMAERECRRARRYGFPVTIGMLDVDKFKSVNDRHGHEIGDLVLKALTECCRAACREQDLLGRLGGEEFLLLLPHTTAAGGQILLERIRERVAAIELPIGNDTLGITVSIGASQLTPETENIDAAIRRADAALLAAKRDGRNRVTFDLAA